MITAAGGTAVAIRVDHTLEGELEALFARIEREQGRLDVLVNSVAGAAIWAAELRKHGLAAVAITPGFLRSERMLENFGVTEENWRDGGKEDKSFLASESPLFVGRAVAALAQDPQVLEQSGQLLSSGKSDGSAGSPIKTALVPIGERSTWITRRFPRQ
jgi:NAD(P)-dependent dehydrogenase (short-subunit alcohol dehydrogenase family)